MIDFLKLPSPCYVLDEELLDRNLATVDRVRRESGAEIIVALKACAMWSIFPELAKHSDGATASSAAEARLVFEEFGRPAHTYAPTYTDRNIDEILRCLMLMRSHESTDFVIDMPTFLLNHASFDLMELARVTDYPSLLECLAHTSYAAVLKACLAENGEDVDPWTVEHALYCYYYSFLLGEIESQFRGQTREQLKKVVLAEIEAKNIQLMFRLKFYYKLDAGQIKRFLYPYHYRLKASRLDEVLEAESYDEMLTALDFLSKNGERIPEEDGIEPYTHRLCYQLEKRLLRFTDKSVENVAQECGLNDANYFSRLFKKVEGTTPGEYRRQW